MLVDDDKELLTIYEKIFRLKGFDVIACDSGEKALENIKRKTFSVVISDIVMPKMDGMRLLNAIKEYSPKTEVIMLTAEGSISGAVNAVKNGAFSYFVKPADVEELISNVKKASELTNIKKENEILKERIYDLADGREFIGKSKISEEIRQKAKIIGKTDSAVLITGETGTGKEIIANMIHKEGNRADKPFICVNCGALNENLIESELFGSEKGAYTGSDKQRKGRFELADGGTIFFDEIGELSLNMQTRLLRVLQEKSFERVGGSETIKSDFRIIAATNRDLKEEIAKNRFRPDLYYRINIIPIEIPPLRDRVEDIPVIFRAFVEQYSREMNKSIVGVDDKIMNAFAKYKWPGNVRELSNIVERMIVLSEDGRLSLNMLPEELRNFGDSKEEEAALSSQTKAYEREYIIKVMKKHGGTVAKAAEEMQISKKSLYKKLKEYDIKY